VLLFVYLYLISFFVQEHCEVDPIFIGRFGEQLGCSWKIFDSRGRALAVDFNKSFLQPRLSGGWSKMGSVFGFKGHRLLSLFYYGDDLFGLAFDEPLVSYSHIPIYHSRSQQIPYTAHLLVRLTEELVIRPYMVSIFICIL
jgi:hypothetical protein